VLSRGGVALQGPETRVSLIARLQHPADDAAWDEFNGIYRPLIVRVARLKGLQHADAEDMAQEVLAAVRKSIKRFVPHAKGTFRGWLRTITRNLVINHLTRAKGPVGSGDSNVQAMLQQVPACDDPTATLFDIELKRMRFRVAAEELKAEFNDPIWLAFWLTAVEGHSIADVAQQLEKSEGSIRMSRCRVMARLRDKVRKFEE
tara:strand:+ start:137 stop:745 length:609 start_codon:yes stop_codon:yes gene_type:complete